MADNTSLMQQQQAAQAARQAQEAQKAAKPETKAPSVKFSEVMKNAQKKKGDATVTVLQNNPVAGHEVVKTATSGNSSNAKSKLSVAPNANTGSGSTGSVNNNASTSAGSSTDSVVGGATNSSQQMINATYQMQEMNQDFNLQYLNLQEGMQADSRQYTAMSNVSKTRSDTAKNSLSNVK